MTLVHIIQVYNLVVPRYGCRRGLKHRQSSSCSKPTGLAVPPCDLENLADAIKLIMEECEKAGLFCELQEGTLLGKSRDCISRIFITPPKPLEIYLE